MIYDNVILCGEDVRYEKMGFNKAKDQTKRK